MKKKFLCLFLSIIFSLSFTGCQAGKNEIVVTRNLSDSELFYVGDYVCPVSAMKLIMINQSSLYNTSCGIELKENEDLKVRKKYEQYIQNLCYDELTSVFLRASLFDYQGLKLSDEEKELCAWAAEDYYGRISDNVKEEINITEEELKNLYLVYMKAESVYNYLIKDVNPEVSDDEGRVMHVQMIFTEDEEKALKAAKELKKGSSFTTVAASYNDSEDISYTIERGMLPSEVEEAAYALSETETSGLIETMKGYYFVYCVDKIDEELTDKHKVDILEKRKADAFGSVYDPYVEVVSAKLNEEKWASLSVGDLSGLSTDGFYEVYDKYIAAK